MQVTYDDLVHVGPDTIGGRFLRTFWHPVYRSEDLEAGTSTPIRILGEDFTLYRGDSGKAYIVAPRCAHRLTRLHTGQIHGDKIACLYHGWQYDGTGQCTFQPGEDERFTRNTKIAAYPTEEYLGLIWGYFGEGEAPPMRRLPDFERPGLISIMTPEYWPCNFFNRVDNATDGAHVFFTHNESIGRDSGVGSGAGAGHVGEMHSTETEYGLQTAMPFGPGTYYFHFLMPNANLLAATVGRLEGPPDAPMVWRAEVHFRVPVDDENFAEFTIFLCDLHGEEAERYEEMLKKERDRLGGDITKLTQAAGEAILAGRMTLQDVDRSYGVRYVFNIEDYVAQVGQGRLVDRKQERLGRNDQGTVMLRRLWLREMQNMIEGKPLKQWTIPANLVDMTQAMPSWENAKAEGQREPAE